MFDKDFFYFFQRRLKAEKRLKDQQRKQRVTENRKHLANVRVVQKNLVFVVGLPMRLADADVSKQIIFWDFKWKMTNFPRYQWLSNYYSIIEMEKKVIS